MRPCSIVLVALVANGCSFDPPMAVGDDVATPDADPAAPDAEADAPPPADDADRDGIADATDNCPALANSDQANEDGDPDGDACDTCPQLATPQNDGDGDHIGDDCDPNPGTAGDELLLFEGFNGNALGADWALTQLGGDAAWTVAGGTLAVHVGEPAGIAVRRVGAPGDTLVVETAADVTAVGPGPTRSIALLADAIPSPLAFDFCGVSFDSTEIELYRYEDAAWSTVETMPFTTPLGSYRLRSRTITGPMCTVNDTVLAAQAGLGVGDHIGLRVRNTTAQVAYIAVYRSP